MRKIFCLLAAGSLGAGAHAFSEGFDDITTLVPGGWVMQNNSNPVGSSGWFQGTTTVFTSHSGAANSYIAANYNNTGDNGTISNWLITPTMSISNGLLVSFFTRTVNTPQFPDRLELRMSTNGSSSNVGTTENSVGDFTNLMLTVNPDLTTTGYPNVWTQFSATVGGVSGVVTGRFAMRYFVPDAGLFGNNSDYIGIDDFSASAVPEPASFLIVTGLIALAARRRRN